MIERLKTSSLGQQLGLVAAVLCLLVGLALVLLGAASSKHMRDVQQVEFGSTMAQLIARRVSTALERGDLLGISASLQRFVESSSVQQVQIFDVDGKVLGEAGRPAGADPMQYRAPIRIESDIAGEVVITIGGEASQAAHSRLILSLLGLALLLSLAVYGGSRHLGNRLGSRLQQLARSVALEEDDPRAAPLNELDLLSQRIEALPMDLLRTRSDAGAKDENYNTTAVLYLHLNSLENYVETLDEQSLHRYTDRLHQVVYAAAGFYGGELQVTRQFALAVYFSGEGSAGSAPFRAASCAWLVQSVCRELEQHMSLSLSTAMAISQSELGIGDSSDIYPGLYMQSTLDELQLVCASKPPKILLSPTLAEDTDIRGRLQVQATEVMDYAMLEEFQGPYRDLLERQLRLILRKLTDPTQTLI